MPDPQNNPPIPQPIEQEKSADGKLIKKTADGAIDLRKKIEENPNEVDSDHDIDIERRELNENLNRVAILQAKVTESLVSFGISTESVSSETLTELDLVKIEAKIQDLAFVQITQTTLDKLVDLGIYTKKRENTIRNINLAVTDEVLEILFHSNIPFEQAILLLNKTVTNGWRYPDWFKNKEKHPVRNELGYRTDQVYGEKEALGPLAEDVPGLMKLLGDKLDVITSNPNNRNKEAAEKIAAWAYFTYLSIHPFVDGNGRTSRALAQLVLARLGIKDVQLTGLEANKYGALKEGDDYQWTESGAMLSNEVFNTRGRLEFRPIYHASNGGWYIDNSDKQLKKMAKKIEVYIGSTPDDLSADKKIGKDMKKLMNIIFHYKPGNSESQPKKLPKANTNHIMIDTLNTMKTAFQSVNQLIVT